uniref:Uncharacterized protein n=1 Tax=Sphaerodactylus townsendi TaxID=933632 RepID=A0ACB8FD85_9SAUR
MILEVGDYDIQVAILEALFRLMLKKWRDDLVHNWFEDQHVVNAFKEIKDREFETLTKPADEKLEEFWVDFNCGSESVTFYLNNPESPFWESVRLSKEDISSYCVEERGEEKILKMLLRNSTTINKKEVTKIKIHVDSKFDIASPLSKISEKVKMVILDEVETGSRRDQPEQNETVADNHAEWIKDSADTESLSDIFGSHQSNESATVTTKMSTPVDAVDKGEQTGQEHGSPGQASTDTPAVSPTHTAPILKTPPPLKLSLPKQKDKTVVHSELNAEEEVDSQPMEILTAEDDEKGRKRSSSKEMADTSFVTFVTGPDFSSGGWELTMPNLPLMVAIKQTIERKPMYSTLNCLENEQDEKSNKVSEMKQKVFVQKTPLHRNLEKGTVEVHKTKPSSGYKSHLFSESNQETPGNSPREKSWILNSQKESGYKTIDYTRRKPKFRSKLKVLPLSSPSSSSDHRAKKIGDSSMHREMAKKRRSTPIHSFLAQQQTGGLELADVAVSLSGASSFDDSDASKSKNCDVISGTLPLKDRVSKSKRKLTGFLSGLGEKRLKTTERKSSNEQSSSFSFEPKKLFDSVEMEEATHKGESVDLVEDHVPPMFQEDSGVIAAFESFTNELKKTFWSRYKRTEIYMRNTLKMPEQNMSALLNQIHQCRLKELEHFHKIVLKELDNLEKRSQFLSTLEKDSVDTVHGLRARWRSRECKGDRPECSV